jgi:tRNA (mo5U34)-methyltransferase
MTSRQFHHPEGSAKTSSEIARAFLKRLGFSDGASVFHHSVLREDWERLESICERRLASHGDLREHFEIVSQIENLSGSKVARFGPIPTIRTGALSPPEWSLEEELQKLRPWRKGPFKIDDFTLDTEWQCQLKWNRVLAVASPLSGRQVLDVGTGNGYYLYQAHQAGASFALGLEPSVLFCAQFAALQALFSCPNVALLPLTSEEFTPDPAAFDTVFSMGVLYHRRSPMDHLSELRGFLRPEGELVLETLVVDGPDGYSLVPEGRYAQMRNVWFLPSVLTLKTWLRKVGFKDLRAGQVITTSPEEQRATPWSGARSLSDFLDPNDPERTREGHPAPKRVIITGKAP